MAETLILILKDRWIDGWMNAWIDGWMVSVVHGWVAGTTNVLQHPSRAAFNLEAKTLIPSPFGFTRGGIKDDEPEL